MEVASSSCPALRSGPNTGRLWNKINPYLAATAMASTAITGGWWSSFTVTVRPAEQHSWLNCVRIAVASWMARSFLQTSREAYSISIAAIVTVMRLSNVVLNHFHSMRPVLPDRRGYFLDAQIASHPPSCHSDVRFLKRNQKTPMVNLRFSQIKKPDSLPLCFRIKNQAQVLCTFFARNRESNATCDIQREKQDTVSRKKHEKQQRQIVVCHSLYIVLLCFLHALFFSFAVS